PNPKLFQISNLKSQISNLKSQSPRYPCAPLGSCPVLPDFKSQISNLKSHKSQIPVSPLSLCSPWFLSRAPGFQISNLKSRISNLKSEIVPRPLVQRHRN